MIGVVDASLMLVADDEWSNDLQVGVVTMLVLLLWKSTGTCPSTW